jgi:UDP-N-acetyl-D-mannosaminuronate dehydrogenase
MAERVAVLGLGYVGLPLAVAPDRAGRPVTGCDTNPALILDLQAGCAPNGELSGTSLDAVQSEYGLRPVDSPEAGARDAVIVALAHREFVEMEAEAIRGLGKPEALLYDVKGFLGRSGADMRP